MEMKIKLNDVLNLNQTIKSIIDDTDINVDSLFKFKLLGVLKAIKNHVENFEMIRNEKIVAYGEKNEDGNVEISRENTEAIKKFNDDLAAVIESDVTINITKFKSDEVFNKGLKVEYLMGLYPIIEE